nr:hypothetical protein [Clostridia bacterium]
MRNLEFLGKMPDPFLKEDGTRMTPDEWYANRDKIRDFVVDFEFGGMPPRPEVVRYEKLNHVPPQRGAATAEYYKIYAGTKERQLSFLLEMYVPYVPGKAPKGGGEWAEGEKYPVVLTGDGCYANMESDVTSEAMRRGMIAASFNRLELANDIMGKREGGLYDIYPEHTEFTAISAWAWGYSVVMDVFEQMSFVDETEVGITGHSRGGKTVLLAAVVDERIKYTSPNNSGCHGAVSYRTVVTDQGDTGRRTERLEDMLKNLRHWMGNKLEAYSGREQDLPYDMHYFGALVAPRYYLQNEGMQDYWINPIGAWQNFMAVKECYKYLGCEDHAAAWFRPGIHRHKLPDYAEFIDFMCRVREGKELREHLDINPYPHIERNFDW